MSNQIFWNLELAIKSGTFNDFQVLMNEMIAATKANEEGALNYEWSVTEDKSACHIYERFSDSDAAMVHMGNFGAFADRFFGCLEPTRFQVYGPASAQLKETLGPVGAQFMNVAGGFSR